MIDKKFYNSRKFSRRLMKSNLRENKSLSFQGTENARVDLQIIY